MDKKAILVSAVAVIAAVLVVLSVFLFIFKDDEAPIKHNDVASPSKIKFGLTYVGETEFDLNAVREYYLSDGKYVDHNISDEYVMIYQAQNEEMLKSIVEILGIKGELPLVDYEKEYLLISTGRKIEGLKEESGAVFDVSYSYEYNTGKAFVYKMNHTDVMSGEELERYYWENYSDHSNVELSDLSQRQVVSEGKYHKLYLRKDNVYEYVLYRADGKTEAKRGTRDKEIKFTEHQNTIVELEYGSTDLYYNPASNIFSEAYDFETGYLIYNVVYYMREKSGVLQLILRDAYDSSLYAKIVELPFSKGFADPWEIVKSIKVLDDTHVEVEYYKGDDKTLVKEEVVVYNLKR